MPVTFTVGRMSSAFCEAMKGAAWGHMPIWKCSAARLALLAHLTAMPLSAQAAAQL